MDSSSTHPIKPRLETIPAERGSRDRPAPLADEQLIASTGHQVVLKVYADRTFQLQLPDSTEDIFVPVGCKLFTGDPLLSGVKIKIRNSVGEIFTADGGYGIQISFSPDDHSWYRPGSNSIEMPVFSSRDPETGETSIRGSIEAIEPVSMEPGSRMSPRCKLADLIFGLSPRIRRQSGLEFKLAIFPHALPNARDSEGAYLSIEGFPHRETDWLDGDLLFDDE